MNPKAVHHSLSGNLEVKDLARKEILFKTRDIFIGKVVKHFGDQEVLIQAKGREFRAFSEIGLKEGENYSFQVKSIDRGIMLQALGEPSKNAALFQRLNVHTQTPISINQLLNDLLQSSQIKEGSGRAGKILIQIKQHLHKIVYRDLGGDAAAFLRSIRDNGMSWESKIARLLWAGKEKNIKPLIKEDLKALLLSLRETLKSDRTAVHQGQELQVKVEQALQCIEQNQLLSLMALKAGMGPLFFIPAFPNEGLIQADAFLKEKKKKEHGEWYLVLFLEFSQMGPLEVHIRYAENKIRLQMFSVDQERADYLRSNRPMLEEELGKAGIVLASFACEVKNKTEMSLSQLLEKEEIVPALHLVI